MFFWDNIQLISNEAHWFSLSNFASLIIPKHDTVIGLSGTGNPPLLAMLISILWNIVGYHLWVHHVLIAIFVVILLVNLQIVLSKFVANKYVNWVLLVVVLESALLSQFVVSSPDFILFTAFVLAVRAILENRKLLLSLVIFILCCISIRGVFTGVLVLLSHQFYVVLQNDKRFNFSLFIKTSYAYLPTFLILLGYYLLYFSTNGWFFTNSNYSEHYAMPDSPIRIIKHIAEFILRSVENGRIVIWILSAWFFYKLVTKKLQLNTELKFLLVTFLLIFGLFVLFIFISQMPFSARYFMPHFFLLTILVSWYITHYIKRPKVLFAIIIFAHITGNLWVYPDEIAKSWDTTLAHIGYYKAREECFNYIDKNNYNYSDISAGFCLYGNRRYIN